MGSSSSSLCDSSPPPPPKPSKPPAVVEYPIWECPGGGEVVTLSVRVGVRRMRMGPLGAARSSATTREPVEVEDPRPGCFSAPPPPRLPEVQEEPQEKVFFDLSLLPGRLSWEGGRQFYLLLRSHVILPDKDYRQISVAPRSGGEALVLTFDGSQPALAAEWLEALKAMQDKCFLLDAMGMVLPSPCFESRVHDCLTTTFAGASGTALRKFYYEGGPGSRYVTLALLDSFRTSLGGEPKEEVEAGIFARFLELCFTHPALRVFFLAFTFPPAPSPGAPTPTSSRAHAFDAIVKAVLAAENGHWPTVIGPRLLELAAYPMQERGTPLAMGSNKELEWLRARVLGSTLRSNMLNLPTTLAIAPEALLPYLLDRSGRNLVGVFLSYAAATQAEHALHIVDKLPVACFDDDVLLKLLMHSNMHGRALFVRLCDLLTTKNLLSQALFERLCNACFDEGILHVLEDFVLRVMLEPVGVNARERGGSQSGVGGGGGAAHGAPHARGAQVSEQGARALLRFSVVLIERLAQLCDPAAWARLGRGPAGAQKVSAKNNSIVKLLEMALVLEQKNAEGGESTVPGMSMATVTGWVFEAIKGTPARLAKATCLGKVIDDTGLAPHVASLLCANKPQFDDVEGPSMGGSMASCGDLSWAQRGRTDIINATFGFISLGLEVEPEAMQLKLFQDLLMEPAASSAFFRLLGPSTEDNSLGVLRPRLVNLLQSRHGMLEGFKEAALSRAPPVLFTCSEHFSHSVLDVLRMGEKFLSQELFVKLALVGIKLREFAGLSGEKGRLRSMETFLSTDLEYTAQLSRILDCILERPEEDFFSAGRANIVLEGSESVTSCVTDAACTLGELSGSAKDKMQIIINSKLRSCVPSAWPSVIKGLGTVATFLKYINLERLELAHSAYASENTEARGVSAGGIAFVQNERATYTRPLVPAESIPDDFDGSSFERIMDGLRGTYADSLRNGDTTVRDHGLLAKISAEWMRKTLAAGVAIAPRNVQGILYLVAAQWLRAQRLERQRGGSCKALMGTMGTGEGKSLAFAMLASFAVKELGMKVHILENTASLKHRDYEDNKSFFEFMDITVGESQDSTFPATQVTYCLRGHLESHYRNTISDGSNVEGGANDFKQTLLLVDEVDSVIVCENLQLWHQKKNDDLSRGVLDAYRAADSGIKPPGCSDATWAHALEARGDFLARPASSYAEFDGFFCVKNAKGQPDGLQHYDMDYYNVRLGKDVRGAAVNKSWYVASLPYLMSRYASIVGLSGSLGGDAEKDYLKSNYKADFLIVPNFLNTCEGTRKYLPALIGGGVQVEASEAALQSKVVELALSYRDRLPVVIICGAQIERCRALTATLKSRSSTLGEKAVLEITGSGLANAKIREYVVQATKPVTDTATSRQCYPITVTDYEGGRGHDFAVNTRAVNAAGGLLVIITEIPTAGEREWVQWKGRTARSDKKGQYAVILSRADATIRSSASLLAVPPLSPNVYDISLASELLKAQDVALRKKLADTAESSKPGISFNALCDAFYTRYHAHCGAGFGSGPWFPEQVELSALLDGGGRDLDAFRRKHCLPPA